MDCCINALDALPTMPTPSCLFTDTAGAHGRQGPLRSKEYRPLTQAPCDMVEQLLLSGLTLASPKGGHP